MTNTKRVTVMGLIAERDAARMAARHESDRILKMLAAEVDRLPSGLTVPVLQMPHVPDRERVGAEGRGNLMLRMILEGARGAP